LAWLVTWSGNPISTACVSDPAIHAPTPRLGRELGNRVLALRVDILLRPVVH
jgi:hypothetical protein